MTGCLTLYEPVNTLKPVGPDIWIVDGPEIAMNYLPGFPLPFTTRMTVIRLGDGTLWVHSPTPLTDSLKAEIDALGPVAHIISPNRIHYWWVGEWKQAWPGALTHTVRKTAEDAEKKGRFHQFDLLLTEDGVNAWDDEIDQLVIEGGFMDEAVFFHRMSKTLIVVDLIENFEPGKVKCGYLKPLLKLGGVADPNGSMPRDLRLTFWFRRAHLRERVEKMIAWQPQRLLIAHGRWYQENATGELRRAFGWLL